MMNTQLLGAWGESYAAQLYMRQQYRVLVKNSFNRVGKRLGEIDIIVQRKNVLVFVEVKTRISSAYGLPEESITSAKQNKIIRSVQWFLSQFPEYQNLQPRIDVCAILLNELARTDNGSHLDKYVKYSKIITNAVEL